MNKDNFNLNELNEWFVKPILFFVLGCLLIAVVLTEKNRWIGVPVFLAGSILIIGSLSAIELLFDIRHRIKQHQNKTANFLSQETKLPSSASKQKAVYRITLLIMVVLAYTIGFSGGLLENYINWKTLAWQVAVIGAVAAYSFSKIFYYIIDPVFEKEERAAQVQLCSYLIPFLLCFHALVLFNQFARPLSKYKTKAIVEQVNKKTDASDSYIFLRLHGKTQRFEMSQQQINLLNKGDTISVEIWQGALGYNYIKHFN